MFIHLDTTLITDGAVKLSIYIEPKIENATYIQCGEKTNLRLIDSSVSNIIANLIPIDGCRYVALLYIARGITNGEGLVL